MNTQKQDSYELKFDFNPLYIQHYNIFSNMTCIFQVCCCLPKLFRQFLNSQYNFIHLQFTCYLLRKASHSMQKNIIYSTNLIYNLCRVSQLVIVMESHLLINNSGIETFLALVYTILVSRYSYYHVIQVQFLSWYPCAFSILVSRYRIYPGIDVSVVSILVYM